MRKQKQNVVLKIILSQKNSWYLIVEKISKDHSPFRTYNIFDRPKKPDFIWGYINWKILFGYF